MRAILSAPGSRGDVNPMIAIGKRLRQAGHEVVISLAEPYAEIADRAGLTVESVIDRERFTELLGNQDVWKPVRGARAIIRHMAAEFLQVHEAVIEKYFVPGNTILVSHPLDLASRVFRDANESTPLVDVHLQPSILRTYDDPPRLSPWWFELSRPQWAVRAAYWLVDRIAVDPVIVGPLNQLRAKYSLPAVNRVLNQWWLSPDRILAMYPDWYAPATGSFCPRLVHCGFPLADVDGDDFTPPIDRPIVFTSGTAHHHCRKFFELAAQACVQLGRPGLLLSTFSENFPTNLPASVRTMPYAAFGQLLPQCSAIVHHGGIGTTSQAMVAGIPQVIRPLAFDQFDNATRVEKLGCGRWLRSDKALTDTLQSILCEPPDSSSTKASAYAEVASRLKNIDAVETAAREIESVARLSQTRSHQR